MQKKIAIVSIIVALIIVISVSIGTTYSLWTTSVHQESTNTIDVGCFNITFNDQNIAGAGNINLANAYPMSKLMGSSLVPYRFTISNTCSVAASYNVLLETLNTSTMDETKLDVLLQDSSVKHYVDNVTDELSDDAKSGMKLTTGYLAANESITYSLRVWIDYDVTVDTPDIQGKIWNGRIVVNSEATFTKPKLTNKVLSGENVILDASVGSDKTISTLACYYGTKTSQSNSGTAIGTTKCQYPVDAEYAKFDVTYSDGTSESSTVKKLAYYAVRDGQFIGNAITDLDISEGWLDYYITRTQEEDYVSIVADYSTALSDDGCGWLYGPFNANDYIAAYADLEQTMTCGANQGGLVGFVIPTNDYSNNIISPIINHEATSSPYSITSPRNSYIFDIKGNPAYNETDYTATSFQFAGLGQCTITQKIYNLSIQYAE